MKWHVLAIVVAAILCVAPAAASITQNFQSFGYTNMVGTGTSIVFNNLAANEVSILIPSKETSLLLEPGAAFTYASFNTLAPNGNGFTEVTLITLYDSSYAQLGTVLQSASSDGDRDEIKMVGGAPTLFVNGVQKQVGSIISVNPTYMTITLGNTYSYAESSAQIDDIVCGGSDPHVVGTLPSNFTLQRDLINPSSTGAYAWSNATSAWVLTNSNYFYIDADTTSQQTASTENFDIINYNTGTIVNTTTIQDQTSPRNQLQYNISAFLSTSTSLGTQLPDGQYVAEFRGYPLSASSFWIISNGAVVSWDKTSYPQNSNAYLTYSISSSYWQTSTYAYSLAIVSTTGTTLQTYTLTTQTGTETLPLNSATYPQGVYYAEVIATPIAGGTAQIMNYAATTVTSYVYLSGYVMNAQTGLPLQNANVSVGQAGVNSSALTSSTGAYTIPQTYLTGSTLSTLTNLTGYTNDTESFIPLSAGNIYLNISLMPSPPTYSGVNIGGIVRDNQYGNVIPSATVSVYNTTTSESYSATTNIAGYYDVSGLTANRVYNVMSKATGYSNSSIAQVVAVGA